MWFKKDNYESTDQNIKANSPLVFTILVIPVHVIFFGSIYINGSHVPNLVSLLKIYMEKKMAAAQYFKYVAVSKDVKSGQSRIFHQHGFPGNKGMSLPQLLGWGCVRSILTRNIPWIWVRPASACCARLTAVHPSRIPRFRQNKKGL